MKLTEQQGYMLLGASPALALGIGLGLGLGVFIVKKKIENKYLEISNREIAEAKQFYSMLNKKDDFKSPEAAVETLGLVTEAAEAMSAYQGNVLETEKPVRVIESMEIQSVSIDAQADPQRGEITIVERGPGSKFNFAPKETIEASIETHNIFTDNSPDEDFFDYEEELKHRGEVEPYIISRDEFMEGESDNTQITLTYYEGDGVLTDEKEQPIPDIDETVGEDNLQRFGYGSMDIHVVYIRNPRLDVDFEVNQSQGKYAEEVLGFIEHSDRRVLRKFRGDDE